MRQKVIDLVITGEHDAAKRLNTGTGDWCVSRQHVSASLQDLARSLAFQKGARPHAR